MPVEDETEPIPEEKETQDLDETKSTDSEEEPEIDSADPKYHAKVIARTFRIRCKNETKAQLLKMVVSDQLDYKDP